MIDVNEFARIKREIYDKNNSCLEGRKKFIELMAKLDFDNEVKLFEMYPYQDNVIKGKKQFWQYLPETKYSNTRTKLKTETRAEIDKLPFEKMLRVFWSIISELIKNKYHFCVFYAEGGRSPHIIIYDFEDLKGLNDYQREIAQREFWRSLIPFDVHQLDQSIWQSDHFVPLEFAPHWKHEKPFELLFEWKPEVKKCNQ